MAGISSKALDFGEPLTENAETQIKSYAVTGQIFYTFRLNNEIITNPSFGEINQMDKTYSMTEASTKEHNFFTGTSSNHHLGFHQTQNMDQWK